MQDELLDTPSRRPFGCGGPSWNQARRLLRCNACEMTRIVCIKQVCIKQVCIKQVCIKQVCIKQVCIKQVCIKQECSAASRIRPRGARTAAHGTFARGC